MKTMKILRLLAVALLVGGTVEMKAQFGPQKDMDSKYATELIKAGTPAPDFKMLTPEGKKFQFKKWAKGKTVVGSGNLLMEGCHIAHDVIVGDDVIIGNTTKLAGEVTIDDHAILSACVLVHQFCRIGGYTMVGGGTRTSQSIMPYSICAREPATYCGLNIVGLRRRGFEREVINTIHEAYRIIFQGGLSLADAVQTIKNELTQTPEINYILNFIEETKQRGFVR